MTDEPEAAAPAGYCEGVLEGGLAEAVADGVVLRTRRADNAVGGRVRAARRVKTDMQETLMC